MAAVYLLRPPVFNVNLFDSAEVMALLSFYWGGFGGSEESNRMVLFKHYLYLGDVRPSYP